VSWSYRLAAAAICSEEKAMVARIDEKLICKKRSNAVSGGRETNNRIK
jgi:hypothetical protein